ncbi:TspO/MBR family protein [Leptolyngbya sp. FACHB-261]|uniref:TspO/MBR family protein n=1 Tax=Leptolyngbya sp. FACHB-261 TaxID=2692806 RepID=UPI001681D476|nr:TspO/MBR family protein [Leptolyngbya sp. FACHB-261]MBD2101916.1 TspO/MBR family protein [Leptolyngbya sp. FACHB-261]
MSTSGLTIGAITFLVALGGVWLRLRDVQWFAHLKRPDWLSFEPAIPFIWTFIFACGAWSATQVWESDPGSFVTWLLMGLYLLLEIFTVAYIPVMLRQRSLAVGTILGAIGVVLGVVLTLSVWPLSGWAALLLLPYVLWSPIGTYTTWEMIRLNPQAV